MEQSAKEYGEALAAAVVGILQRERESRGVTYEAIGAEAGMTAAQVHRYLKQGRPIPMAALPGLCRPLSVDPISVIQQAQDSLREQGW